MASSRARTFFGSAFQTPAAIARVRVWEVAFDAETITNHFTADADTFGLADNDGDGILNNYERLWPFLDPNNPADAAMDQDSDGATNLQEYRANTNPTIADTDGDGVNDGPEINRVAGPADVRRTPMADSAEGRVAAVVEGHIRAIRTAAATP